MRHDRAAAGRDRSRLPIERFFDAGPPWLVFALATLMLLVVGVIDRLTGPEVLLAPFYLLPVVVVTWNLGRLGGVVITGVSVIVGQVAAIHGSISDGLVPSWNALNRLAVILFIVWLVSTVKASVVLQHDRVEHEHRVAEDLRHMNDAKDTLLHAVSHDLKGPLAGIIGAMQTIRRAAQLRLDAQEVDSLYEVVEVSGAKMNRLVDDMLDLERIDRGQVEPEREPTDVGALARRIAEEISAVQDHPIDVSGDPAIVEVDPGKVERILENLLANAGRHTPIGTPIHVRVIGRPDGVVIEVEDEGPGIPSALREVLFEPFRQGESAAGRGVGIGLSLVRRFARLHGGDAVVADRPGGGARFVVTLPGTARPAPAEAAQAPEEPARSVEAPDRLPVDSGADETPAELAG
jgi:signal transduction histidine kinase